MEPYCKVLLKKWRGYQYDRVASFGVNEYEFTISINSVNYIT